MGGMRSPLRNEELRSSASTSRSHSWTGRDNSRRNAGSRPLDSWRYAATAISIRMRRRGHRHGCVRILRHRGRTRSGLAGGRPGRDDRWAAGAEGREWRPRARRLPGDGVRRTRRRRGFRFQHADTRPASNDAENQVAGTRGQGEYERRQRLYRVDELRTAVEDAGFSVVGVFADADGSPFDRTVSSTMWIVGQRRPTP